MTPATLFPSSVVGSMPRPAFVRELLSQQADLAPHEFRQAMERAVAYVVSLQEQAGLDVVTDGEWWRKSYIGIIAQLAHGFELSQSPDGRPWTIVVDKLSAKKPGAVAAEIKYLKQLTTRRVKATLPSPALLGERMWDRERSSAAYPTREAFVRDCVPVLRRELELVRDAGADIVQIDDPHLCLFVDPSVRERYDDPEAAALFAAEVVNEVVDGVDGVHLAVHLCRRAGARVRGEAEFLGGYDPILDALNRLRVHHLTMEFTAPGVGDTSVFRKLRDDFEIGLGCVSVEPGNVDSVDTIVKRVEHALEYLAAERVTLNPDCGFAPGSAAEVSLDEVYQKLRNEAEASRQLRAKYG